jgi:hypothetical protein
LIGDKLARALLRGADQSIPGNAGTNVRALLQLAT